MGLPVEALEETIPDAGKLNNEMQLKRAVVTVKGWVTVDAVIARACAQWQPGGRKVRLVSEQSPAEPVRGANDSVGSRCESWTDGGGVGKKAEKLGEMLSYGDTTQLFVITHDRLQLRGVLKAVRSSVARIADLEVGPGAACLTCSPTS
uniref:Uncharacterized protein n=1 Tax=Myotis myotis TaxID=51298 RepID=A0A7J7Z4G5_MYOMY|nr:hypothetical protein mMyoMyo1_010397 [Myotis myotis]